MLELPSGYVRNRVLSNENISEVNYWTDGRRDLAQIPAYKWVRRRILSSEQQVSTLIEIGCGNGGKTIKYFSKTALHIIGIDQRSGIQKAIENDKKKSLNWICSEIENQTNWLEVIASADPGIIISLDVIEHLERPDLFLRRLREVSFGWQIVFSTPNRDLLGYVDSLGPPKNPLHVQEWSKEEFRVLIEKAGFHVNQQVDLLPRGYRVQDPHEWKKWFLRVVRGEKILDYKLNQLWLVT